MNFDSCRGLLITLGKVEAWTRFELLSQTLVVCVALFPYPPNTLSSLYNAPTVSTLSSLLYQALR